MGADAGILVADLGGTRLRVAIFDAAGDIVSKTSHSTDQDDPSQLVRALQEAAGSSDIPLFGAVVGVPGPVSYAEGRILIMPNLPRWQDELSGDSLSRELDMPVILANDADLGALGEHRFGAGIGTEDMVYVTASTGVGAGVIINGRLLHGRSSLGEGGHMVIDIENHRTLEELGSGTALERLTGVPGEETTDAAKGGDQDALAAVNTIAAGLAVGVHNLVHCFMPERVVLGGGFANGAGELVLEPVRRELAGCSKGCSVRGDDVRPATGGDDVGLMGGYALARDTWEGSGP